MLHERLLPTLLAPNLWQPASGLLAPELWQFVLMRTELSHRTFRGCEA